MLVSVVLARVAGSKCVKNMNSSEKTRQTHELKRAKSAKIILLCGPRAPVVRVLVRFCSPVANRALSTQSVTGLRAGLSHSVSLRDAGDPDGLPTRPPDPLQLEI